MVPCVPELRRCPWATIPPEAWVCVGWWLDWREFGALPYGGKDLMEQPAYVFEAIRECHFAYLEFDAERQSKAQREQEQMLRKLGVK